MNLYTAACTAGTVSTAVSVFCVADSRTAASEALLKLAEGLGFDGHDAVEVLGSIDDGTLAIAAQDEHEAT